jgi:hypothetical protein
MEKWGFGLSKKKFWRQSAGMSMKTKYPHHSEEEFLVMIFLSALKERIS